MSGAAGPDELIARALELRAAGRSVYACLVVSARGSTPQTDGALMLVDDTTEIHGTIGGGCVEAEVRQQAYRMLERGERGRLTFKLDHDYGWDDGLICGGSLDVAVAPVPDLEVLRALDATIRSGERAELVLELDDERCPLPIETKPPLHIAGAGHVGQALARLALRLGFEVSLYDDRTDLLSRFAPEGALRCDGDIAEELKAAPIDERAFCVIVTRGHKHDEQALHAVLGRGAKYVGMIGSRRKVKLICDDLRELGVPDEELAGIHAPIGLDIGSVTVEEIALSIMAQLVAIRRGVDAPGLKWNG